MKKGWEILLSRTQAESGRTAKQEQERISPNHVPTIYHFSVQYIFKTHCSLWLEGGSINPNYVVIMRVRREEKADGIGGVRALLLLASITLFAKE